MRTNITRILLGVCFFCVAIISVAGQQRRSAEDPEIKQLRSDISLLTQRPPQSESSLAEYRKTLLDLRIRLAALLNQQIGATKRDIRDFTRPNASARLKEYAQTLEKDSKDVEDEIKRLAADIAQAQPVTAPQPIASTKPDEAPPKSPARRPLKPLPVDAHGRKYGQTGFEGEPINLNLVNATLQDLMDYLRDQYGVNYVIDPSVPIPVVFSYQVQGAPWNIVLDAILKSKNLGTRVNADVLRIATLETLTTEAETRRVVADLLAKEVERKANFDAEVKSFSADKLKAAAAPASLMADKSPQIDCHILLADPNPPRFPKYDQAVCFLAKSIQERIADGQRAAVRVGEDKGNILTILIAKLLKTKGSESLVSFITEATEARTDQQVGAGPSSSGTTSLVSKGGVPYLLGFAVENGAATESTSGTTATFRINPAGLINTFAKKGFITGYQETENDAVMKMLRKTSIGFSFDTSRGNNPGTFVGDRQQLSQFSVRYEFVNERDPRNKKYEAEWERLVGTVGREFASTTWATTRALQSFSSNGRLTETLKDPALQAWLDQTNEKLAAASTDLDALVSIIRSQADLVPAGEVTAETVEAVTSFAEGFQSYEAARSKLLNKIAKGKILTFEYTNNRGVNAPDLSNFNFIAATGTGSRFDLTANGSFTFFNKLPLATATTPRPGRIRDFQFAAQITKSFNVKDSQFDFWFSGRYERLMENASTVAGTMMPNTKGDIAVGQIGLNVPIKSLGIKFPISMTFANRTELIKEKTVRGNIGFTFNWDTLFSKLKPF